MAILLHQDDFLLRKESLGFFVQGFRLFVCFLGFFSWLGFWFWFFSPVISHWQTDLFLGSFFTRFGSGVVSQPEGSEEQKQNEFTEVGGNLGKLLGKAFPKQNYSSLLPQEGACKLITGHFREFHSENVLGALKCSLQKRWIRYSDRFWWCRRLYIHLFPSVKLKFIFMKILRVTTFGEVS